MFILHINEIVDGDEHEDVGEEKCVLVTGPTDFGDFCFALQDDDTVTWWEIPWIAVETASDSEENVMEFESNPMCIVVVCIVGCDSLEVQTVDAGCWID